MAVGLSMYLRGRRRTVFMRVRPGMGAMRLGRSAMKEAKRRMGRASRGLKAAWRDMRD